MKKIITVIRDTFGFKDKEDKLPLKEAFAMVTASNDANIAAIKDKYKGSKLNEKTYLRGVKDCCVQFELLIEVEVDEEFLGELTDTPTPNPIINTLEMIKENIEYNRIVETTTITELSEDNQHIHLEKDGEQFKFNKESISLNSNKKYYKALTKFSSVAQKLEGLQFDRIVDDNPDLSFSLTKDDFEAITPIPEIEKAVDLIEQMEMIHHKVVLVRPVLRKDRRLKWTISFIPDLPDNLILDQLKDYEAYVKDEDFMAWSASEDNPGFKNGDWFYCDITYNVHHKSGDMFATIKKVELRNIKQGEGDES